MAGIPLFLDISLLTYQNFNPASVITFSIKTTFVDIPRHVLNVLIYHFWQKGHFHWNYLTATKSIMSGVLPSKLVGEV